MAPLQDLILSAHTLSRANRKEGTGQAGLGEAISQVITRHFFNCKVRHAPEERTGCQEN